MEILWRDLVLTGEFGRFTVDSLRGWEDRPAPRMNRVERPQSHGAFDARVFADSRTVLVTGYCSTSADRDELLAELDASMTFEAEAEPLTITHAGRTLTAQARLTRFRADPDAGQWQPRSRPEGTGRFTWTAEWLCPDPFRYAPPSTASTGFVIDRSGLEFDLFTDGGSDTGFLEFSDPGEDTGIITLTNPGTADAWPVHVVDGPVPDAGFELRSAGRTVRYARGVPSGSTLVLDTGAGTAELDGADVSQFVTLREWTPVPPKGSLDVLFHPVEGTSAAQLTTTTRPAFW